MNRIAIIRIAGKIGLNKKVKDTLKMLNLHKKNTCVVIKNGPTLVGMLIKVKDHVTWGEINEPTFKKLLEKRGRLPGNKPIKKEDLDKNKTTIDSFSKDFIEGKKEIKDFPGLKRFFRLSPPQKGYGNKGTKKAFSVGGALGYRKDKINGLIERML